MNGKTIWAIGHSTHSIADFISMLQAFDIHLVADIRRYPGSKRYPHFNKDALEISLRQHNIGYSHLPELGGRRNPRPDSHNTAWRVTAFRGYADYMETEAFGRAMKELENRGDEKNVAYMCSEAVWWSCHRSLVSDYLKCKGWTVMHIMSATKADEHPYTKPAVVKDGILSYVSA